MPADDSSSTYAEFSGNNGARIFDVKHEDIDNSTIDVSCVSGSIEIQLDERIWWTWKRKNTWYLAAGNAMNQSAAVDSSVNDGDHRLRIFARANGTSANVNFTSWDA
jgi:hypothetical protein